MTNLLIVQYEMLKPDVWNVSWSDFIYCVSLLLTV